MKIQARINIVLEVDTETYCAPLDNNIEEEMSDVIYSTFYEIEGVEIKNVTTTQTGEEKSVASFEDTI